MKEVLIVGKAYEQASRECVDRESWRLLCCDPHLWDVPKLLKSEIDR